METFYIFKYIKFEYVKKIYIVKAFTYNLETRSSRSDCQEVQARMSPCRARPSLGSCGWVALA